MLGNAAGASRRTPPIRNPQMVAMNAIHRAAILVVLLMAKSAQAQQPTAQEEQVHVVRPGDTLWELSRLYLSNPFRWPEIFTANRPLIANPHWIYPRARLLIPGLQAPPTAGQPSPPPGLSAASNNRMTHAQLLPTVFSTVAAVPEESLGPRVRMTPVDEVAAIQPGALLAAGLLLPDSALPTIGEIRDVVSATILARRTRPQIQLFDKVLITVSTSVEVGSRIQLMRADRRLKPYGRVFLSTGTGRVLSVTNGVATVEVDRLYDIVAIGDVALAIPAFPTATGAAAATSTGLEGSILAFETPQPAASLEDLAFLSIGSAAGVAPGDEFVAYISPVTEKWGVRPAVDVARLQVIRVGERTSTARVVGMEQPALAVGLPVRLVARLP